MNMLLKLLVVLFRNSPEFRGKWRVAAWLERNKARFAGFDPAIFHVQGYRLKCYPDSNFHLYMYGPEKNKKLIPLMNKYVRPGGVAIDVGAHSGFFTICMAAAAGASGKIYAFEASPLIYKELIDTVQENGFTNVIAKNNAVCDSTKQIDFFMAPSWKSEISTIRASEGTKISINGVSLDDAIPHSESICFIKIDVEGAEMQVLKGMEGIIRRDHPVMAIEITDSWLKELGSSTREVFEFLSNQGYTLYAVNQHDCVEINEPPTKQVDALCLPRAP